MESTIDVVRALQQNRTVRMANVYWGKGKGKRSIAVSNYSLTATGTHMGSHSYLPPGRGDNTIRVSTQSSRSFLLLRMMYRFTRMLYQVTMRPLGTVSGALLLLMLEDTRSVSVHKFGPLKTSIHLDDDPIFAYCNQGCSGKFWFGETVSDT